MPGEIQVEWVAPLFLLPGVLHRLICQRNCGRSERCKLQDVKVNVKGKARSKGLGVKRGGGKQGHGGQESSRGSIWVKEAQKKVQMAI